jgi:hypothetical protein
MRLLYVVFWDVKTSHQLSSAVLPQKAADDTGTFNFR